MGVWKLPLETFFETTTPLRTFENAPGNRYLLLYTNIYLQSGSEETSTSMKTDTRQNVRHMNHLLVNQNEKRDHLLGGGGGKTL